MSDRQIANQSLALREIRLVDRILRECYHTPRLGNLDSPFEELLYILLSQRTREAAYQKAYSDLRRRFHSWDALCNTEVEEIERILRPAGMAGVKSRQIVAIARRLKLEFGRVTLDPVRRWRNERAFSFLTSLPRVSTKTALCVMMFSLRRSVFPADANVIRVSHRLGVTQYGPSQHKKAQKDLERAYPSDLRYSLHVNMVSHGRYVCKRVPLCNRCEIRKFCDYNRRHIREKSAVRRRPTVMDIFAGAGGMADGFRRSGFQIMLATDIDETALSTFELNHPELSTDRILRSDIAEISDWQLIQLSGRRGVDVVVGGPPCQGFSIAGAGYRTVVNGCRFKDDPRNQLYRQFLRVISVVQPKLVLMENVPGILTAADGTYRRQILDDLRGVKPGYVAEVLRLDAVDYGVPQSRRRVLFVAARDGPHAAERLRLLKLELQARVVDAARRVTLWKAIRDLPALEPGGGSDVMPMTWLIGRRDRYRELVCDGSRFVFNHQARPHNPRDLELFALLQPGEIGSDAIEKYNRPDLMVYRNDVWLDKYRRLREGRPSPTVTAHLSHMGNMFIHPRQARTLTVREAARLQSFRDDYVFLGGMTKQFRMVGNAVPPLLAEALARSVRQALGTVSGRRTAS